MGLVYAGLDIVALSSLNEGTPVTLIEGQAANKAIISTNVGGVLDVVIEGVTALTCEKNDLNAYTKILKTLVEDDDMRLKMGNAGYNHVRKLFSYKRLIQDVEDLYTKLLNENNI